MDSGKRTSIKSSNRRTAEVRRSTVLMRRVLLGFKAKLDDELRSHNATAAQMRFLPVSYTHLTLPTIYSV